MQPMTKLMVFGGLGVTALLASLARPAVEKKTMDWMTRVIGRVSGHEGGYDAQNLNTDNAGLSFGMIQWSQRTGQLGILLAAMAKADPEEFRRIFGPASRELLEVTRVGGLGPVGGALLWKQPWTDRFGEAGQHAVFQAVQRKLTRTGVHMAGAIEASTIMGVHTERALALTYDTAVQQGAHAAKKLATDLVAKLKAEGKNSVPYDEMLERYAQRAANRARRTRDPGQSKNPNLEWRKVGNNWHLFAGRVDLYRNIRHRRFGIVTDTSLTDTPVQMA